MALTDRLDQIQARAAAATPGPWEPVTDNHGRKGIEHSVWAGDMTGSYVAEWIRNRRDAEFIAAAPSDVAYLVAALRAALRVAEDIKDRSLVDGRIVALDIIDDIEKALTRPMVVSA